MKPTLVLLAAVGLLAGPMLALAEDAPAPAAATPDTTAPAPATQPDAMAPDGAKPPAHHHHAAAAKSGGHGSSTAAEEKQTQDLNTAELEKDKAPGH